MYYIRNTGNFACGSSKRKGIPNVDQKERLLEFIQRILCTMDVKQLKDVYQFLLHMTK